LDCGVSNPKFKYKHRGEKETRKNDDKRAYSVSTSNPVYQTLRLKHGLQLKKRKKATELESMKATELESESSDEKSYEEESD
jgi:hypothetical protein